MELGGHHDSNRIPRFGISAFANIRQRRRTCGHVGRGLPDGNLIVYQSTFQISGSGTVTFTAPAVTPLVPDSTLSIPVASASVYAGGQLATVTQNSNALSAALFNPSTQSWGPVQQIATNAVFALGNTTLAIAADASGAVTIVYSTGSHLMATTKPASASVWPAAIQLDTLAAGGIYRFNAVGGSGGTMVIWSQLPNGGIPAIESARFSVGASTWSAATQIDDGQSPTGADNPAIALDNAGFAHVVYTQTNTGMTLAPTDGLYLARFNPTTSTWGPPARAVPQGVAVSATTPAIAADAAGNVLIVFSVGGYHAWSQYLSSTGVIDMAPDFDLSGFGYGSAANIVMDNNNEATAVWYLNATPNQIRADRFQ